MTKRPSYHDLLRPENDHGWEALNTARFLSRPIPTKPRPKAKAKRKGIASAPDLLAERDALLEAEQRYQLDLHTVKAERDELLEALQDLADTNNDFSEALVRARLAIARAKEGKP